MEKVSLIRLIIKILMGGCCLLIVFIGVVLIYRKILQKDVMVTATETINNGGISELREIELGGISQYIAIDGENLNNPICLFLHGGPGFSVPYGISSRTHYQELTKNCTAVYWDQRGAGKSYDATLIDNETTYQRLEFDAIELVDYLLDTFQKDKIYLVGHSWGTILGIRLAERYPTKFYGYFAQGQVVNDKLANHLTYDWLSQEFTRDGDTNRLESLRTIGKPPYKKESSADLYQELKSNSEAYIKKNEGEAGISIFDWIYLVLSSPDLTIKEIFDTLFIGSHFSINQTRIWTETNEINFLEEIKRIDVPIYFIQGMYDQITPNTLVTQLFNLLEAPEKELRLLENSAHYLTKDDQNEMFKYISKVIENNINKGIHP